MFELYEWIAKLVDGEGRWRLANLIVWTLELVRRLEASEEKIMCTIDDWLNRIIGGFVTEFTVDTSISYSKAECRFFRGLRGKYLK